MLRNSLLSDFRASRQRLVAAQDEVRRRFERNLHDGAQQQLVALAVKERLVGELVDKDPRKAGDDRRSPEGLADALDTLRDLARGSIRPSSRTGGYSRPGGTDPNARPRGLSRSTVAYPPEIEAAVYFFCLEALQNVSKYADASKVTIRLRQWEGDIDVSVIDDGRGFDRTRRAWDGAGNMTIGWPHWADAWR